MVKINKYIVIEHWDEIRTYHTTLKEAREQADYYQKEIEEYAYVQGEFPNPNDDDCRIEIVKLVEVRDINIDEGCYKYKRL